MDQPFSETEQRFVLAEALKTSDINVGRLLNLLNEAQIQPQWHVMLLPQGRHLKSCVDALEALRASNRSPSSLYTTTPSIQTMTGPANPTKRKPTPDMLDPGTIGPAQKRRQSGGDPAASGRTIQPRPPSNGSPQAFTPAAPGQPGTKKRGRPSKRDVEARNAEALKRGEILQPPTPRATTASRPQKSFPEPQSEEIMGGPDRRETFSVARPFSSILPVGAHTGPGQVAVAPMIATPPSDQRPMLEQRHSYEQRPPYDQHRHYFDQRQASEQRGPGNPGNELGRGEQAESSKGARERLAPKTMDQSSGENTFQLIPKTIVPTPQTRQYDPVRSPATPPPQLREASKTQTETEARPRPMSYAQPPPAAPSGPPPTDRPDV